VSKRERFNADKVTENWKVFSNQSNHNYRFDTDTWKFRFPVGKIVEKPVCESVFL